MPCSGKSPVSSPGHRTVPPQPMTCCCRSSRRSASMVLPSPFRSRISMCVPSMRHSSFSLRAMATLVWQRMLSCPLGMGNNLVPWALLRLLFNLCCKLGIPGQHMVEGVFVEGVEVAIVHRADSRITGLAEEQGDFAEEGTIGEGCQHCVAVRCHNFYCTATDEVHLLAILPNAHDVIARGEDHRTELQRHFTHQFMTGPPEQRCLLDKVAAQKERHLGAQALGQSYHNAGFIVSAQPILPEVRIIITQAPLQRWWDIPVAHEGAQALHLFQIVTLGEINVSQQTGHVPDNIAVNRYP